MNPLVLQPSCRLTLKLRKCLIQSACQPTYHYLCSENFCDILLRSHSIKIVKLRQNLDACVESAWTVFADENLEYRPLKGLKLDWGHSTSPEAQQPVLNFCKKCKADRNCYIAIEDLEVACSDGRPIKLGSSLFGVVSNNSVSMVSHVWRLISILSLPYSTLGNSQDSILVNIHDVQSSIYFWWNCQLPQCDFVARVVERLCQLAAHCSNLHSSNVAVRGNAGQIRRFKSAFRYKCGEEQACKPW